MDGGVTSPRLRMVRILTISTTCLHKSLSSRRTHRSQEPFLGRYGRVPNSAQPTSPSDDAFVYVESVPMKKDKSLPTPPKDGTPSGENIDGYFDGAEVGASGSGLGRKTSLLKKVGTVVKGRTAK